jgi:hypothetical protein
VGNVRALISAARANTLVICGIGHMAAADLDQSRIAFTFVANLSQDTTRTALWSVAADPIKSFFNRKLWLPEKNSIVTGLAGLCVTSGEPSFRSSCSSVQRCWIELRREPQFGRCSNDSMKATSSLRSCSGCSWRATILDFSQALRCSRVDRPTAFVVGSRNACPPRLENFSVSGALFKKGALPRHFNVLTRKFHYVEPVLESTDLSRVVLLRYDVDVNLVETTLANAIEDDDRTPRSQLFGSVVPFVLQNGGLVDSDDNTHLGEIVRRARDTAAATDATQTARIDAVTEQLVSLGTPRFQDFLDRAIVPKPHDEQRRHAAGQQHVRGDYFCDCWAHRRCIDLLCDDADAAAPVAHVILALARIAAQGLEISLIPLPDSPANVRLSGASGQFDLCVVYPFNFDADATEMAIRGGARPKVSAEPGYIVLGTSGRAGRPGRTDLSGGR